MKKVVILVTLLLKVKKRNQECAYEDSASDCSEKKL